MRQYRQHHLKGNKGRQRPQRLLFFDTETYRRVEYRGERSPSPDVESLMEMHPVVQIRKRLSGSGLNLETLKHDYSSEEIADLRKSSPSIVKRGGLEPDLIAAEYGYSYDDFIRLLMETPTNTELKEKYRREIRETEYQAFGYDKRIEKHRMSLAWSCFCKKRNRAKQTIKWCFHNDPFELCKYILSLTAEKSVLWIFAHNAFFDLQVSDFYHYFTKWGWILDFTYSQGLTYILAIRKGKRSIKVLSTTNFFPVSLKKLGDMMGLPKLDVDFKESTREELSTYCRRDVEIIKYAVEYWFSFLDEHDLGNFALTRASQAFTAFRHRFMPSRLTINKETDVKDWERNAYFGGRTECFQIGDIQGGPFTTLDVNSMYPYVMRHKQYPTRFLSYSDKPRMDLLEQNLEKYCVLARVTINTDEPAYAKMQDKKLIFPVGRFETWVCSEGLKYALNQGHLLQVHEIAYYEKGNIFGDYVDFFYDLKNRYAQENNAIMREMVKTLLNSLYGKFGQKRPILEEEEDVTYDGYFKEDIADMPTGEMLTVTKLFNKRFATRGHEASKKSFPAIAAHVTEYARFYLWNIIQSIGRDRVLYCDTDSVKLRQRDLQSMTFPLDEYKLGALKNEGQTETLIIYGPKDYETEKGFKVKGVPKGAVKVAQGHYKYQEFMKQNTHLREKASRFYIVMDKEKILKRNYTKGRVLESGLIEPFRLPADS